MGCINYVKQLIPTWRAAHCMMINHFFFRNLGFSLGAAAESSTAAADGGQPSKLHFECDKWPLKVREFSHETR